VRFILVVKVLWTVILQTYYHEYHSGFHIFEKRSSINFN
jgi:hypothetical protein